jgi:hypothetical protein
MRPRLGRKTVLYINEAIPVRQANVGRLLDMVMSLAELGAKNDCAGENQQ